jgi:predicted dehydrogenase
VTDLARYLIGELSEVSAAQETFVKKRPLEKRARGATKSRRLRKVDVDDAVAAIGRFRNGALATIEATRFAPGRKNSIQLEINGSDGSLVFDLEEMNRLRFFSRDDPAETQGFRDIMVTEPVHPYVASWWPPGHIIGYEHSFVHTVADFVGAVVQRKRIQPDFADALETQRVLDAVARSARTGRWIKL